MPENCKTGASVIKNTQKKFELWSKNDKCKCKFES